MFSTAGPNLYQKIVESSPSAVVVLDVTHEILYVNPAALHVLDLGRESVGRNIDEVEHLRPLHIFLSTLMDSSRTTFMSHRGGEVQLLLPGDRESLISCTASVIRSDDNNIEAYTLVARNASDIRGTPRANGTPEHEVDLAPILSGIVESVRQPLNALLAMGHVLQHQAGLPEEDQAVRLFHAAAEELNRTVTGLLTLGSAPRLECAEVDLNGILAAEEERLAGALRGRQASLEWPRGQLPKIWSSPEELRTVIERLLDNALDAIYMGGRIRVTSQEDPDDETIALRIEDDGIGIEPSLLSRIAEPCFTTKPGSAGMGLTIANRLMEEMGGAITVDSDPEQGTAVTLRFKQCALPARMDPGSGNR